MLNEEKKTILYKSAHDLSVNLSVPDNSLEVFEVD